MFALMGEEEIASSREPTGLYTANKIKELFDKYSEKIAISAYYTVKEGVPLVIENQDLFFNYGAYYTRPDIESFEFREPLLILSFLLRASKDNGKSLSIEEIKKIMEMAWLESDIAKDDEAFVRYRIARAFAIDRPLGKGYVDKEKLDEIMPNLKGSVKYWANSVRAYDKGFLADIAADSPIIYRDIILAINEKVTEAGKDKIEDKEVKSINVYTDIDLSQIKKESDSLYAWVLQEVSAYVHNKGRVEIGAYYDEDNKAFNIIINLGKMSNSLRGDNTAAVLIKGERISALDKQALVYRTDKVEQFVSEKLKEKGLNEGVYPKLMSAIRNMRRDKDEVNLFMTGADVGKVLETLSIGDNLIRWLEDVLVDDAPDVIEAIKDKEGWEQVKAAVEKIVKRKLDYKEGLLPLFKAYAIGVANNKFTVMNENANIGNDVEKERGGVVFNLYIPEILVFQ